MYVFIATVSLLAARKKVNDQPAHTKPIEARKLAFVAAGVVLFGLVIFLWNAGRPDGRLHVAFLDVGQGDSIFVQTPNGRQLLIDGGRYPSDTLDQLGRQMPFWDRSLDLVIATHPDADHIAGLVEVLDRYEVSSLITNGEDEAVDATHAALLAAAAERGIPLHATQEGETILLDEAVRLDILHAGAPDQGESRNDASIVTRLTFGALSVLLTGDAESAAETTMLENGVALESVILKAGHHGANTSSSAPFLQAVSPQIVIISAGRDNSYGHPHAAMLGRVEAIGATTLRTDELGTLEMVTDGRQMWWSAEHAIDPSLLAGALP